MEQGFTMQNNLLNCDSAKEHGIIMYIASDIIKGKAENEAEEKVNDSDEFAELEYQVTQQFLHINFLNIMVIHLSLGHAFGSKYHSLMFSAESDEEFSDEEQDEELIHSENGYLIDTSFYIICRRDSVISDIVAEIEQVLALTADSCALIKIKAGQGYDCFHNPFSPVNNNAQGLSWNTNEKYTISRVAGNSFGIVDMCLMQKDVYHGSTSSNVDQGNVMNLKHMIKICHWEEMKRQNVEKWQYLKFFNELKPLSRCQFYAELDEFSS